MAVRGWGGSIATAIGIAAGAGAAQLGLGYGLGIIAWVPAAQSSSEAAWVASLAWATWIAATSTVAGAVCAERLGGLPDRQAVGIWRLALAVAAAVGALVTVALIAVPARAAVRADTFSPQTIAAGYAVIGVIVGLLIAIAALGSRAIATNVIATVGWLWLLAVVAVIDGVAAGRGLATAQLGVWQFTSDGPDFWFRNFYLPGATLTLGAALIIGGLAAWPAARRGDSRVGVAVSGAFGPLLVAAAYFLAAPRLSGVRAEQLSAYLVAPYAVIAGLAGSVIVSAMSLQAEENANRRGRLVAPAGAPPGTGPGGPAPAGGVYESGGSTGEVAGSGTAGGTDTAARGKASVPDPVWSSDSASTEPPTSIGTSSGQRPGVAKGKSGRSS